MELQLIRNATMRFVYAGHVLLVDPYFAPKHSLDSYVGKARNPLIDLPCEPEDVMRGVEALIVSHLHGDHFDRVAQEMLPKALPLFCQPGDEERILAKGFQSVTPIKDSITWQDIRIARVPARHGSGAWADKMGNVSGFVLRAESEPTIYWCGDTIWYEDVAQTIAREQPDVIVTHSSGAMLEANEPIVMDIAQTIEVCRAAPNAKVVAVHLESLDHGTVARSDLRVHADQEGIAATQLLIPQDGETLIL